ncbi:hypothetical protein Hanom_Chr17g01528851 [Helianthus anomalus]
MDCEYNCVDIIFHYHIKVHVGGGKVVYMDEDIDGIREGCSSYGATFIFK